MKCNGQLLSHKKLKRAKRKESKSKREWQKDVWHYVHLGPITTHFIHKMWPVFAGSRKISGCFFLSYWLGTHIKLNLMYSSCVLKKFGLIHLVSNPNIQTCCQIDKNPFRVFVTTDGLISVITTQPCHPSAMWCKYYNKSKT